MKTIYQKIRRYFTQELWNFSLQRKRGGRRLYLKGLRIGTLAIRKFIQNRCMLHASSLTYYTVMATVPALILSFAIAGRFGYHDPLRDQILHYFKENREALLSLFAFVDQTIADVKGGVIAAFGFILLILSVVQLLSNLEVALNEIWKVGKWRTWRRIFSDYFALMILAPAFFVLANSATLFLIDHVASEITSLQLWGPLSTAILFFVKAIPYCLFWMLFTFIYLFMPNTKVPFSSALLGGVIGGTIYVIVQWGYFLFQLGVNQYGTIYGSFVALPLFLVWVQLSWFVLLFGAEVARADQTLEWHEFEGTVQELSVHYKHLLSLWIVHGSVMRYLKGKPPLSLEILLRSHRVPFALGESLLKELTASGILIEAASGYIPRAPAEELTIADVLEAIDRRGSNDFPFIDSKMLSPFEKALTHFQKEIDTSPHNQRLFDVPYSF